MNDRCAVRFGVEKAGLELDILLEIYWVTPPKHKQIQQNTHSEH